MAAAGQQQRVQRIRSFSKRYINVVKGSLAGPEQVSDEARTESMMVLRRWAMVSTVHSAKAVRMVR